MNLHWTLTPHAHYVHNYQVTSVRVLDDAAVVEHVGGDVRRNVIIMVTIRTANFHHTSRYDSFAGMPVTDEAPTTHLAMHTFVVRQVEPATLINVPVDCIIGPVHFYHDCISSECGFEENQKSRVMFERQAVDGRHKTVTRHNHNPDADYWCLNRVNIF